MKTIVEFVMFVAIVALAGIRIEDHNTVALVIGIFLIFALTALILIDSKEHVKDNQQ
jgi:hypothetical protein